MTSVLTRWTPVALGLAVLVGCVAVPGHSAVSGPDRVISTSATTAVAKSDTPVPRRILIMGASYTAGVGATPRTEGYAYLLGAKLGCPTEVRAIPGTGYLNPGPRHQGTFAQQIRRVPQSWKPNVLFLQGGRNDGGYPSAQLEKAIAATIQTAHQRFHGIQVVLLGPIPPRAPVDPGEVRVEAAITRVAHRADVSFIDPIHEHWITPANAGRFAGAVPGHPNNAGYAYIADRTAADLGPILHIAVARGDGPA
jgi:lysophospholipase L1-like esterase